MFEEPENYSNLELIEELFAVIDTLEELKEAKDNGIDTSYVEAILIPYIRKLLNEVDRRKQ